MDGEEEFPSCVLIVGNEVSRLERASESASEERRSVGFERELWEDATQDLSFGRGNSTTDTSRHCRECVLDVGRLQTLIDLTHKDIQARWDFLSQRDNAQYKREQK